MKKLLLILLALLMLTGCGNNEETLPAQTTEPASTALYDPDSPMEESTGGAVRAYPLDGAYDGVIAMGSKLLLQGGNKIIALSGDLCEVTATLELTENSRISEKATAQGTFYYREDTREVVLLNPQLREIDRIQLPEEMQGNPTVSLESNEIYYRIPGQIRAMDMDTGISRLIRSHSYASAALGEAHFNGQVLTCQFADEQQNETLDYISTQTGQTLWSSNQWMDVCSGGENYIVARNDGGVAQLIIGQRNGEAKLLTIPEEEHTQAMAVGGVLGYTLDTDGLHLALYQVASGSCSAAVYMDGIREVKSIAASEQYIWILAEDKDHYHAPVLYRWDVKQTAVNDSTVYTDMLYTAENPDTEGLAACQERVDAMNKQYGVRIRIWQDAVAQPGEYTLVPEYQVQTINKMLDALEPALAMFPEGFLQKTVESGWICIDLVRQIDGRQWSSKQQWVEGDHHILLTDIPEELSSSVGDQFLQHVGYAIDSHVLGNSRDYDDWNMLNPEGFQYTDDMTLIDSQEYWDAYMEPEDSAFLELTSMCSPAQDRATLFYRAMYTDQNSFTNDPLQQKLKRMCEGIREAYGLEKSDETYPWEQYLTLELDYNNIR